MKNIPYSSPAGSLMYLMICTRLDVASASRSVLNQFQQRTIVSGDSSEMDTEISLGGGCQKCACALEKEIPCWKVTWRQIWPMKLVRFTNV